MAGNTATIDVVAFRADWASGLPIVRLCERYTITKDQFVRLRDVWELPHRDDRSKRYKPPREKPPPPAEEAASQAGLGLAPTIAARAAVVQEKWDARTRELRAVIKFHAFAVPVINLEDSGLPKSMRDKLGGVSDLLEDG